jgi:acetyltransferase-like isoleucine patch superfamily enzyme
MSSLFSGGYYTEHDLATEGFGRLGSNVRIEKSCTIIGVKNIQIGSNTRIDGYTTIVAPGTGYVRLGSFIHVAGYVLLSAGDGIVMEDFSGLSHGVRVYSRSGDYGGQYLTNPMVPAAYSVTSGGEVRVRRHVVVGSGTVILPGVEIGEGSSVGALSVVSRSLDAWGVYAGAPVRRLRERSRNLLALEERLRAEMGWVSGDAPALGDG